MHSVLRDLLEERVAGSSEEELLQQSPKILYSILAETLPKPRLVARLRCFRVCTFFEINDSSLRFRLCIGP